MAELYSEKDIVRRIVEWKGNCVDADVKDKRKTFTDMTPACLGFAPRESQLEHVLAAFNPVKSSYRVFNEIHITQGDKYLTVGFGHFTYDNITALFLEMPDNAWLEFRTYVTNQLLAKDNTKLFEQYKQDYVVAAFLKEKNKTVSDLENAAVLGNSLDFFFGRDLLNGKKYSDIKKCDELTTRYLYKGEAWTIIKTKKGNEKRYLSLWADTVLLLSSFDPDNERPPKQYDAYPDYKDVPPPNNKEKISRQPCTKFVNNNEIKSVSPICVRLFPGHLNDNGKCSYWFYSILGKALLIKSVAKWQYELWMREFYNEVMEHHTDLGAKDVSILTGLLSWKSNGTTVNSNPPFATFRKDEHWRNMANLYYLLSAKEVLVNKTEDADTDKKRQAMINTGIQKYGELFTALIIWSVYNMAKSGNMRNRQRAMWEAYFNTDDFAKKYKDDKTTSFDVSHIQKVQLEVSTTSVVLTITVKKETKLVHSYTFLDISKKNTTTP